MTTNNPKIIVLANGDGVSRAAVASIELDRRPPYFSVKVHLTTGRTIDQEFSGYTQAVANTDPGQFDEAVASAWAEIVEAAKSARAEA